MVPHLHSDKMLCEGVAVNKRVVKGHIIMPNFSKKVKLSHCKNLKLVQISLKLVILIYYKRNL